MNCTSCGAKLPPGAASCQVCGTPTPYNVTGQRGDPSQYDPTIASYGGNPPTPPYPYNSGNPPPPSYGGNPPTPSSPYIAPPPPTDYGAPQYGAPGTPAADPYSQPGNNYVQQQQPSFSPPPAAPTPPPRKSGRGKVLVLAIIAVVVVLVAAGIIGAVAVNNTNTQHANATATAQTFAQHLTATSVVNQDQTATAVAVTATYPFSNKLVLNDPLTANSNGFKWDEGISSTGGGCTFSGQSYHVSQTKSGYFNYCIASNTNFSNFTYEVEMMVAQGDAGGLIFRANTSGQSPAFYYFRLNQDGTYYLFLYVDSTATNARTLAHGTATGFNTGLNQTNLVSVVAKGSTLALYVNKQQITSVTDSTFTSGQIGLAAEYINGSTEVVYTNAKVWQLP
ncbi:MAG: family 16 glycoside hydrolase [Ktedonobacteraceae bacterium]